MRGQQKQLKKLHRMSCMQLVGAVGVEEDTEEVLGREEARDKEGEVVQNPFPMELLSQSGSSNADDD